VKGLNLKKKHDNFRDLVIPESIARLWLLKDSKHLNNASQKGHCFETNSNGQRDI
jgi:hypothetical protein